MRHGFAAAAMAALAIGLMCGCAAPMDENGALPVKTQVVDIASSRTAAPVSTSVPTSKPSPIIMLTPEPTPAATAAPTATPDPDYIASAVCRASDYVNIRAAASKDSQKTGELPGGETVFITAYEGEFAHIVRRGGDMGYVSCDYLMTIRGEPDVEVPSGEWALILINPTNYIPDGFEVTLTDIGDEQVDSRIYDIVRAMFDDAAEDGVNLRLVSGYRSHAHQSRIYEKKVQSYLDRGFSREDAEREAATITARPDTSEHQTGLALDIVSDTHRYMDETFAQSDAYMWLTLNAKQYGFIMRYAAQKQPLTGVIYEPWHWRFVGTETAEILTTSGECLEEYLNRES